MATKKKPGSIKIRKTPKVKKVVDTAVNFIEFTEKALKENDAALWAIKEAYRLLASKSEGQEKRRYNRRVVLLSLLLKDISTASAGHAEGEHGELPIYYLPSPPRGRK